jgi:hypothetical protein
LAEQTGQQMAAQLVIERAALKVSKWVDQQAAE